jgi:hypothetical protein
MSRGFVYILSNPSMPGIVKIGKTTRSVEQRAFELYQTGVPTPFEVVKSVLSPDCDELERLMHQSLDQHRINNAREFFLLDAVPAMVELDGLLVEQVGCWLAEFLPTHSILEDQFALCPSIPEIMATHVGLSSSAVVEAYSYMMPEDLHPAIARMAAHQSGAETMQWLRPIYDGDEAVH